MLFHSKSRCLDRRGQTGARRRREGRRRLGGGEWEANTDTRAVSRGAVANGPRRCSAARCGSPFPRAACRLRRRPCRCRRLAGSLGDGRARGPPPAVARAADRPPCYTLWAALGAAPALTHRPKPLHLSVGAARTVATGSHPPWRRRTRTRSGVRPTDRRALGPSRGARPAPTPRRCAFAKQRGGCALAGARARAPPWPFTPRPPRSGRLAGVMPAEAAIEDQVMI